MFPSLSTLHQHAGVPSMALPIAILSQRLLGSCEGKSILVKEGISPIGYGFLHANCTVIDESFDAKASYWSRTKFRANIVQDGASRSEEHTSELQSLMRISYAVFCLKQKNTKIN